eukprot:353851-Chlamydomonas_euryale.AAC.10
MQDQKYQCPAGRTPPACQGGWAPCRCHSAALTWARSQQPRTLRDRAQTSVRAHMHPPACQTFMQHYPCTTHPPPTPYDWSCFGMRALSRIML